MCSWQICNNEVIQSYNMDPKECLQHCVESMPQRFEAVLKKVPTSIRMVFLLKWLMSTLRFPGSRVCTGVFILNVFWLYQVENQVQVNINTPYRRALGVWVAQIMMFTCFLYKDTTTSTVSLVSLVNGKSRRWISKFNKVMWKQLK